MAYTFKIDGIEVVADSPAEAAALIGQLRRSSSKNANAPSMPASLPTQHGKDEGASKIASASQHPDDRTNGARLAMSFLAAIDGAGRNGVSSEQMQEALGVDHPKGVGSKMAIVNNWLRDRQLDVANVYGKERTAALGRHWTPGPELKQAIAKAKEDLSGR